MGKKQKISGIQKKDKHTSAFTTQVILFFVGLVSVLIIDGIWLGLISKGFYGNELALLSRDSYIVWSALMAWVIIVLGIVFLVLPNAKKISHAVKYGALYGFVLYGLYDFTNYSILNHWSLRMTIVDVIWGMTLCTILSIILFYVRKWIGKN